MENSKTTQKIKIKYQKDKLENNNQKYPQKE